jgi:hypothetical protein
VSAGCNSWLRQNGQGARSAPIIEEGGVDLNMEEPIEKRSLREFNECAALTLHRND